MVASGAGSAEITTGLDSAVVPKHIVIMSADLSSVTLRSVTTGRSASYRTADLVAGSQGVTLVKEALRHVSYQSWRSRLTDLALIRRRLRLLMRQFRLTPWLTGDAISEHGIAVVVFVTVDDLREGERERLEQRLAEACERAGATTVHIWREESRPTDDEAQALFVGRSGTIE